MTKIRITFILFFLSIFIEGIVRKWIMPSFPAMIAFSIKYALLLILSFFLWTEKKRNIFPQNLSFIFKTYCFIVFVWAFIIGMLYNGWYAASVAVIQYCIPIIIVYAIVYLHKNQSQLNQLLILFVVIAIPIFVLAFIQYFSPPTALINRYGVDDPAHIAMVGNNVRVTSVFSYISPFGDCCVFLSAFSICMMSRLKDFSRKTQMIILILFLFSIIGGFMSGSRMVIGLIGTYILIISMLLTKHGNLKFLILLAVIIATFIYVNTKFGFSFVDNFLHRVDTASDNAEGRIGKMLSYEKMFEYAGFLGFGSGFASNALQPLLSYKSELYFEEELGRMFLDFGAIGAIGVICIRLCILKIVYDNYSKIKTQKLKSLALACFLSILPMSLFLQLCLYNWFAYMCYYMFIGIAIVCKNIDSINYEKG